MGAKPKPVIESRVTGTVVQSDEERRALHAQLAEADEAEAPPMSIAKPPGGSVLDRFKSTKGAKIAGVEQLLTALPHHRLSETGDWARLHPDEDNYWSHQLSFVRVPIQGTSRDLLHFILEDLADAYLPSKLILRFRLALATKPYDKFFLCQVPSLNLDNAYNETSLKGCLQAKEKWTMVTSRRDEGVDAYKVEFSRHDDAFPEPNWPKQSLGELVEVTFKDRMIETADHPGLLRLVGARQSSE